MTNRNEPQGLPVNYSIQVQGSISDSWTDWLDEMEIVPEESDDSITTLSGPVADQAALRGVLAKIWDLNLTLVTVTRLEAVQDEGTKTDVAGATSTRIRS